MNEEKEKTKFLDDSNNDGEIVLCEVVNIFDDHLTLKYNDSNYECDINQISDYPVNLFTFFKTGIKYKFLLQKSKQFSYKKIRPKLLKNRKFPIPTINKDINLEKFLLEELNKK